MTGLMLHCGGQLKTREEVFAVPTPEATQTYVPLSYESFLMRIEKQLAVEGMAVKEERLALSNNGQRMFGLLSLEMPGHEHQPYGCVLGLRNSYDKSVSTGVCIGASVFVCDNLSFNGEVTFARKHTANLMRDLSWLIVETVSRLPGKFMAQSTTFDAYQNTGLSDRDAHDLIIRMVDEGAINVGDIRLVLKEWREPRHPQFTERGKNAWRLFNAATEAIKGDLWRLPARTTKLHAVLDANCPGAGLLPSCRFPSEFAEGAD
ncbi:MAG: DUF932 domain-containing protein [Limisphaerales bacterium]